MGRHGDAQGVSCNALEVLFVSLASAAKCLCDTPHMLVLVTVVRDGGSKRHRQELHAIWAAKLADEVLLGSCEALLVGSEAGTLGVIHLGAAQHDLACCSISHQAGHLAIAQSHKEEVMHVAAELQSTDACLCGQGQA